MLQHICKLKLLGSQFALLRTILEMLLLPGYKSKTRANTLKRLDFLSAGYCQHLAPKTLGFATEKLFPNASKDISLTLTKVTIYKRARGSRF